MCTCIMLKTNTKSYFGRNLDLEYSFNEKLLIIPRNYNIKFKEIDDITNHYAIIGSGTLIDNYPLLADATNELGLSIAGLNFPNNAVYYEKDENKINITPYELSLYLLATCKNVNEAKEKLNKINILNKDFSKDVKLSSLHFMVSDLDESFVLETTIEGMKIYYNPYNVLTNNPPFSYHIANVSNYMMLSNRRPYNNFSSSLDLKPYSYGQGAIGLPGDYSSSSRFIKTLFVKENLDIKDEEIDNINQFFVCLDCVKMPRGCIDINNDFEITRYSSCVDMKEGKYYFKTYDNPCIKCIDMHKENLDSNLIKEYSLYKPINIENIN